MPRREPGEPYYRITVDEAAELHGSEDVAFIDVRRPDEYAEGHIKDALFIPVDDVLARVDELPRWQETAFHLRPGGPERPGLRNGGRNGHRR